MRSNPNCNGGNRRVKLVRRTIADCLHHNCQIEDYQNKDKLSVCRIFSLQLKPKLGRIKPSTGPHAACKPRVGHSCSRPYTLKCNWQRCTWKYILYKKIVCYLYTCS